MTWRVAAASLAVGVLAVVTPASAAEKPVPGTVRLDDARIKESSGLVDLGRLWVTANDSGDSARLFVVDPYTGRTVGVTRYADDVVDVEALAPGGGRTVWVGDIGDNARERRSVAVFKVEVARGQRTVKARRYKLVYPQGRSFNAESMFVDRAGRVHVITQGLSGVVYRAPAQLSSSRANRLREVGRVREFATDAALTRDGRHVLVRGPRFAGVYTVPGLRRVAGFRVPPQPQGEGISVGPDGFVRVSSEGRHTAVRGVAIPPRVSRIIDPPAPSPSPSPSASPSPSPSPTPSPTPSTTPDPTPSEATEPEEDPGPSAADDRGDGGLGGIDPPWLLWSIPAVIALGALGIGLGLRRRGE